MLRLRQTIAFLLALCLILPSNVFASDAQQVSVVLQDGTVVEGTLIGIDNGAVTVKAKGKIREYGADQVKKVFDSNGHKISLSDSGSSNSAPAQTQARPQAQTQSEAPAPAARPRHNGARVAANILLGVGIAGILGGGLIGLLGVSTESDATSTYYTGPNYSAGAVYTIPGQKGYYTYTQYTQYYTGQGEAYAGLGVFLVGTGLCIAGIIVGANANKQPRGEALLNLNDGQLALGVPAPTFLPNGGIQGNLLQAQF
jgi:hypothetical protein